jgi:hypothetical protein
MPPPEKTAIRRIACSEFDASTMTAVSPFSSVRTTLQGIADQDVIIDDKNFHTLARSPLSRDGP